MPNALANLVYQTTTGSGFLNLTLASVPGWRTFNTAFGVGGLNVFAYAIRDEVTSEYEIGIGHLVDSVTLSRDTVLESSSGNAPVVFSAANTKHVVCDVDAARLTALLSSPLQGEVDGADQVLSRITLKDFGETVNAIGSIGGGTQDIDLTLGNVVTGTVDTSATTFTFSNPTASPAAMSFAFILTDGGSPDDYLARLGRLAGRHAAGADRSRHGFAGLFDGRWRRYLARRHGPGK